jgi:hypothetical protein
MRPELIGVAAGGVFGLFNMVVLRAIAARVEDAKPAPEKKRTADILRTVAFAEVFVFAGLGYFLAPMLMK